MNPDETSDSMVRASSIARDLNINPRTLDSWVARPDLAFPKPIVINRYRYWMLSEIEAWKASRSITTGRKVA